MLEHPLSQQAARRSGRSSMDMIRAYNVRVNGEDPPVSVRAITAAVQRKGRSAAELVRYSCGCGGHAPGEVAQRDG